ncbi:30S ribosomal protein S18 [Candidatus Gottesmanbacteria bacterium]|nr:30S ribosomal protein S18 [Candidatus Gottesmanbacteria bacterium]MBI5452633.1 30S ribosomal protein S18 [Candidatus Gottesmanbacteria bacterium]
MRRTFRPTRRRIQRIRDCFFCKQQIEPDYKDVETIKRCVTERGKITPRLQNGVCQKHQKLMSMSVKRARFLALLPYIVRPS